MGQLSLFDAEFAAKRKQICREVFLSEMDAVIPWAMLAALVEPGPIQTPAIAGVRTDLRRCSAFNFMQQWFALKRSGHRRSAIRRHIDASVLGLEPELEQSA